MYIKKRATPNKIFLTYVSTNSLDYARNQDSAHEYFNIDSSKEKLPFLTNSIDSIIMFDCLEHLSDPYFAITEAKRVCKKSGFFYISIPDEKQQEGYRGNNHAFIYPGLFYIDNFKRFLKQMYLKILIHSEIRNPFTPHKVYDGHEGATVLHTEEPLHHFFCL